MARSKAWAPSLRGIGKHSRLKDCVETIWWNAGAIDEYPDRFLLPYQLRIFWDLRDGLDEQALAHLHDYWDYDLQTLAKRGENSPNPYGKPRILLRLELTAHHNLKCEWQPFGINYDGSPSNDCDFRGFWRFTHRSGGWDSRPSNELFFIRDVGKAVARIERTDFDDRPIAQLNHVLLQGVVGLIYKLKARLERHFEVTMATDLFVTYEEGESFGDPDKILSFEIDDPVRRQEEAELQELATVEDRLGFSEEHFLGVWADQAKKKRSGPAPAPENVSRKVAKALREEGFEVTSGHTDRLRVLIDKYHPVLPSAEVIELDSRR